MASVADICNLGLSNIGARAQISSISPPDGTVEAGLCARFYPIARKELLEAHPWAFAQTRVELSEVTNDSDIWSYAYQVPSGMINALRVLQLQYLTDAGLYFPVGSLSGYYMNWRLVDDLFTERGSADFEIEGSILRTNEPQAVLKYTTDVTDTTKFSPMFVTAMGMLMGSYLAGPIIKGVEGAKAAASWRQAAYAISERAQASNANSASERAVHVPEFIRTRS